MRFFLDFACLRGEVHAPETGLRLQGFDAGLQFIRRQLANPRNLKFCPLRSALQTNYGSRLQSRTQGAESSAVFGNVDGMCEMSVLIDEDLHWQHHFPAWRFPFIQHHQTIMVRRRGVAKLPQ